MSTEPTTTQQAPPAWGDPQPPAPKWSGRKTLVAAAVAIAIAAVGAVAIYAGTSSNDSSQQGFGGGPGGGMGRMAGGQAGMTIMREALHGDYTVSENGSYVTERMQRGEVTALSSTSITVKSADGYTQTYTIDSSTEKASNLATGSKVMVVAKVSGDTATATSVTDANQTQGQGQGQGRGQGGFPGGGTNGGPGMNGGQQGGMPAMPGQGQTQN